MIWNYGSFTPCTEECGDGCSKLQQVFPLLPGGFRHELVCRQRHGSHLLRELIGAFTNDQGVVSLPTHKGYKTMVTKISSHKKGVI